VETWHRKISLQLHWPRKGSFWKGGFEGVSFSCFYTSTWAWVAFVFALGEGLMIWKGVLAKRRC